MIVTTLELLSGHYSEVCYLQIMKSEISRITHEQQTMKEKIKVLYT